jgi:hypothetical protein
LTRRADVDQRLIAPAAEKRFISGRVAASALPAGLIQAVTRAVQG